MAGIITGSPTVTPVKRDIAIDYFKSYLVIGMILAHTISLLYTPGNSLTNKVLFAIVNLINLISFPGFFFCFGYVNYKSYFLKDYQAVKGKLISNALRILLAYYISAFASALFLSDFNFSLQRALKILVFNEMPAFSEFLLSFFLIVILSLLLFRLIIKVIDQDWMLIVLILVSVLASAVMPYHLIKNNQLGLFVGTPNFTGFPVLQYLCYFLTGVLFAKKQFKYNWKILVIAVIITMPFIGYVITVHHLPSRFPPDTFWITGSVFFLYLYYIFSIKSEYWFGRVNVVLTVGHQTLFYLLLSNIFLFSLTSRLKGHILINGSLICVIYAGIMLTIYYLGKQVSSR